MTLCQALCEYNPEVSGGPSAPCILDCDYLNPYTPHSGHQTSVSKVWRSQSCPVLSSAVPSTHRQNQPPPPIIWGLGKGHHIKEQSILPYMPILSAKSSLSPHSSPTCSQIPHSPAQSLLPLLYKSVFLLQKPPHQLT